MVGLTSMSPGLSIYLNRRTTFRVIPGAVWTCLADPMSTLQLVIPSRLKYPKWYGLVLDPLNIPWRYLIVTFSHLVPGHPGHNAPAAAHPAGYPHQMAPPHPAAAPAPAPPAPAQAPVRPQLPQQVMQADQHSRRSSKNGDLDGKKQWFGVAII